MSDEFQAEIANEVERISQLPLEEQPGEFNALREGDRLLGDSGHCALLP